jgi:hypothetical protein
MNNYTYKVTPFVVSIKAGQGSAAVAEQLAGLINMHAQDGWEFDQMVSVEIEVKPGCLAAMFGSKVAYMSQNQAVFRKATN